MWKADVAASDEDYQKVVALLEGCDILHQVSGHEYVVPALLAQTQRGSLDARAFSAPVDMVSLRVPYRDVPPGFFGRLLVLCRKDYSHMDFSDTAAAFYGRGLKAQLFLSRDRVARGKDEVKAVLAKHFAHIGITEDNKNDLLLVCALLGLASRLRTVLQAGANAAHADKVRVH